MTTSRILAVALLSAAAVSSSVTAFQAASSVGAPFAVPAHRQLGTVVARPMAEDAAAGSEDSPEEDGSDSGDVEAFLKTNYPEFHALLSKNPSIWGELSGSENGVTIFAPTSKAFEELGDKKLRQIKDDRNLETAQKLGLYHVVPTEAVSSMRLRTEDWTKPKPKDGSPQPLTIGGVVTMGGEVPVGRKKSGGFLGFGAKEDGSIAVGPEAAIVQSNNVGKSIVHEVDAFVSPSILWRYFDQLQIGNF